MYLIVDHQYTSSIDGHSFEMKKKSANIYLIFTNYSLLQMIYVYDQLGGNSQQFSDLNIISLWNVTKYFQ